MPIVRRRSLAARRVGPRRKVTWATQASGVVSVTSGTVAPPLDLCADLIASGSSVLGATVGPTIIRLSCSSLTSDTNPGVNYGVIVWDRTKSGAANIPDPALDSEDDWMLQTSVGPGSTLGTGGPVVVGSSVLYGDFIRLKSMRRLHQMNDLPFFVLKNDGSATMSYALFAKTLIRLP